MKTTRKILAVMLTVMLVLALSVVTVSAAGTSTLTVTGKDLGGKKVTIVQMFKAVDTAEKYQLVDGWKGFFATKTGTAADSPDIASEAYKYMIEMTSDSAEMEAFAADAKTYYTAHKADFPATGENPVAFTATASASDAATNPNTATFTNLENGSYLVLPASGAISTVDPNADTGRDRGTDAIITNVTSEGSNNVNIKSVYPTIEKTVKTDAANDQFENSKPAGIGDTVTFQLESFVPDMSDYTNETYKYYFEFVDTMSNGLTYLTTIDPEDDTKLLDTVVVTIGNAVVDKDYYTVTRPKTEDNPGNVLKVAFNDLKAYVDGNHIAVGTPILVTYQATINENAVVGENQNSASVVYSNDPTSNGRSESTPDTAEVYTYDIKLHKFTGDENATWENGTVLAGAVFEVYETNYSTDDTATPKQLVAEGNNVYHVAKEGEANTDPQVISPATGFITIKGLDLGTYYIKEVTAPAGYNTLTAPVTVTIAAGVDDPEAETPKTDYSPEKAVYTINNGTPQNAGNDNVGVKNESGPTLPTTGGVGTIIFTVLGAGIIIAGVVLTSRKKKEDK